MGRARGASVNHYSLRSSHAETSKAPDRSLPYRRQCYGEPS
jgi:hypothetical protein